MCDLQACRLPHVVASNISLLAPHLGGKAYPIRSAIVTAIGHLIQKAFEPSAAGADAQGDHPYCCLHSVAPCTPSRNLMPQKASSRGSKLAARLKFYARLHPQRQ